MSSRAALLVGLVLLAMTLPACGRSDAIVVITLHPSKPDILYVATNDYIYKTRDGGRTWENLSRGMTFSRVIAMAIDPVYPATIYAGTKGDAVFKSYDGGQRWVSLRNGLDSVDISSVVNQLLFDPANNNHLYVATTMGVYETQNGGDSWQKRMDGMKEVLVVITLAVDPSRPWIMYAGTSGGVYKTMNRGMRWDKVNNGLVAPEVRSSSRALGVTVLSVDPFAPDTVYAATLNGLYKTANGGQAWDRIGRDLPDQMVSALTLDRAQSGRLYVAGRDGVFRSDDGGTTWKAMNEGFGSLNIRSLMQSPTDPQIWYAGTNGSGLYKSRNGGETWERMPDVHTTGAPAAGHGVAALELSGG